ncbi:MAG TPA: low affinity iron permease family protein [Candidatus Saccharimonadales bacterium]|nr:low affinity iron permease family protein [Candidatus Saccharimonadales bacterium]
MRDFFDKISNKVSRATGTPWAFIIAISVIIVWAISGPIFHFSDTWQLVINTGTTIVTFLMVFLIQNSQNRDSESMELKLNEIIRAIKDARNDFIDLEEMSEEQMDFFQKEFRELAKKQLKLK